MLSDTILFSHSDHDSVSNSLFCMVGGKALTGFLLDGEKKFFFKCTMVNEIQRR